MFSTRLETFIKYIGETPTSFETIIGVSKGSIYKPIKNGKTVGVEILEKIISKHSDLNLEWLITGTGEMLKSWNKTESQKENVHLKSTPKSTPISKSEELGVHNRIQTLINRNVHEQHSTYLTPRPGNLKLDIGVEVHMLDLKAAAATFGAGYLPSDNIDSLGTLTLPPLLAKRGRKYVCLPVDGDSMQPSLQRGDYVVAYLIDPSEYLDLVDDRVYIISTVSDGIVIKRIKNRLRELQFLRLKSDNKEYRSYNLPAHEIATVLEVAFKIDFNLSNKAKSLQDQIHSIEDRLEELQALLNTRKLP